MKDGAAGSLARVGEPLVTDESRQKFGVGTVIQRYLNFYSQDKVVRKTATVLVLSSTRISREGLVQ